MIKELKFYFIKIFEKYKGIKKKEAPESTKNSLSDSTSMLFMEPASSGRLPYSYDIAKIIFTLKTKAFNICFKYSYAIIQITCHNTTVISKICLSQSK